MEAAECLDNSVILHGVRLKQERAIAVKRGKRTPWCLEKQIDTLTRVIPAVPMQLSEKQQLGRRGMP